MHICGVCLCTFEWVVGRFAAAVYIVSSCVDLQYMVHAEWVDGTDAGHSAWP